MAVIDPHLFCHYLKSPVNEGRRFSYPNMTTLWSLGILSVWYLPMLHKGL